MRRRRGAPSPPPPTDLAVAELFPCVTGEVAAGGRALRDRVLAVLLLLDAGEVAPYFPVPSVRPLHRSWPAQRLCSVVHAGNKAALAVGKEE